MTKKVAAGATSPEEAPQEEAPKSRQGRTRISNSFSLDEVEGVMQLFRTLDKGGDVGEILKTETMRRVRQKFMKMRSQLQR